MDKAPTYQFRLNALIQALSSFEKALKIDLSSKDDTEADAIKNGQALKFGYSVELLWKTIKSFMFEVHGIECNSPKSCIKYLFQNSGLSGEDYQRLIEMINQRNELAHIYNEKAFDKIWTSLPSNLELIKKCVGEMAQGLKKGFPAEIFILPPKQPKFCWKELPKQLKKEWNLKSLT